MAAADKGILPVIALGHQPYEQCWRAMQQLNAHWQDQDQLWLVEHPPVYTLGRAGKEEHLLNPGNIPLIKTDRGGQITYHGPGQLVVYCLIDIKKHRIGVRPLVTSIENALIATLAKLGIPAQARADAPGVYVDGAKIAALGLRIKNGRSYHGLSLNYDMDLSPFQGINPCGYAGLPVCQVSDFCSVSRHQLEQSLLSELANVLGFTDIHIKQDSSLLENSIHE